VNEGVGGVGAAGCGWDVGEGRGGSDGSRVIFRGEGWMVRVMAMGEWRLVIHDREGE